MSRLPIRVRLTLVFAAIVAAVLGATGLFLYLRLERNLDQAIDQGLRARTGDLVAVAHQRSFTLRSGGGEPDQAFAEVVWAGDGRVLGSTPGLSDRSLLSGAQLAHARDRSYFIDRVLPGEEPHRVRLLVAPLRMSRRNLVGVVGTQLDARDNALATLRRELVLGGPLALVLVVLAGYSLAAAALRPVERMRRAAAAAAGARGKRLPIPPSRDELARLGETLNGVLEAREEALTQAERALAHERSFVADASHELRTPLALLKGELEIALREPSSVGELEAAVVSAAEEADRLAQLADDLLLLARFDEGALPLQHGKVDVPELFDTIRARFAGRAAEANRSITLAANGQAHLVADCARLEQALGNLVENSLCHGGGPIELAAHEQGGRVELHVRDRGPGFTPAFLEHAFERFSRADEARPRGGSGLGLAIVASIARAHGGTARAANREQGGADVWLSLASR